MGLGAKSLFSGGNKLWGPIATETFFGDKNKSSFLDIKERLKIRGVGAFHRHNGQRHPYCTIAPLLIYIYIYIC